MTRVIAIMGISASLLAACASNAPADHAWEPMPAIPPAFTPDASSVDIRQLGLRRIDEVIDYPEPVVEQAGTVEPIEQAAGGATQPRAVAAPTPVEIAEVAVDLPETVLASAEPEQVVEAEPERERLPFLADLLAWTPGAPQIGRTAVFVPSKND